MNLPDDHSEFENDTSDDFASGRFDDADGFAAGELSADELFQLDDEFSAGDLEEAYRRALEVLEEADQSEHMESESVETGVPNAVTDSEYVHTGDASVAASLKGEEFSESPSSEINNEEKFVVDSETEESAPMSELGSREESASSRDRNRLGDYSSSMVDSDVPELSPGSPLTPRHVIEAALFVGGAPLTTKKLASLFKGSYENAYIEQQIDDLNRHYLAQNRPYEIQLVEGGHRLALRPEFEKIRHRVFGYGPKEVRLSQDALEVLALVAYQQPIHRDKVEECGKKNVSNLLNQLVRRELIAVTRGKNAKDLTYHTTPRFLSLFGIGSLDELPRPDDLAFK